MKRTDYVESLSRGIKIKILRKSRSKKNKRKILKRKCFEGKLRRLGYNELGCNELGYNELGYNELGFNELGYNKLGYNEQIRSDLRCSLQLSLNVVLFRIKNTFLVSKSEKARPFEFTNNVPH